MKIAYLSVSPYPKRLTRFVGVTQTSRRRATVDTHSLQA